MLQMKAIKTIEEYGLTGWLAVDKLTVAPNHSDLTLYYCLASLATACNINYQQMKDICNQDMTIINSIARIYFGDESDHFLLAVSHESLPTLVQYLRLVGDDKLVMQTYRQAIQLREVK